MNSIGILFQNLSMSVIDPSSIYLQKPINHLDDLYSIIGLVEDKLKETSKLILLLFESSQESSNEELENKPVPLKLDIKDEEGENDSSIDSFYKVDKDMIDQELFADQSNQDISHYKDIPLSDDELLEVKDKDQDPDFKWRRKLEEGWKKCKPGRKPSLKITLKKEQKPEKKQKKKQLKLIKEGPKPLRNRNRGGICEECGTHYANLISHRRAIHEKVTRTWTCPFCEKEITSYYYNTFRDHKEKCEVLATGIVDRYECHICHEKFSTYRQRVTHIENKHKPKPPPRKYKPHIHCTYEGCEYRTGRRECMDDHVNRDHLKIPIVKKYSCDMCGNAYARLAGLKEHINSIHLNKRTHTCLECGSSFARRELLTKHELIHSDFLGYPCPYCTKAFKQPAVLYRHKLNCPMNPNK